MYQPRFTLNYRLNSFLQEFKQLKEKIVSLNTAQKKDLKEKILLASLSFAAKLKSLEIKETAIRQIVANKSSDFSNPYLRNYYHTFLFCHQCRDQSPQFSPLQIQKIHQLLSGSSIYDSDHLKLRKEDISLIGIGGVSYNPPSYLRLPILLDQFFQFLNNSTELPPLILGGVSYFLLLVLHPYETYGEEVSRLFSYLLFSCREKEVDSFFSLERGFYQSRPEYYATLKKTLNERKDPSEYDLTPWLEFFSQLIVKELNLVFINKKDLSPPPKKKKTSKLHLSVANENISPIQDSDLQLNPRQEVLLNFIREKGNLVMADARRLFPDLSDDTLLRDLQALQKRGLIFKKGRTKGTSYFPYERTQ